MTKHKNFSPNIDAGWGLIYRLNSLWGQVDPKAVSGDYDGWNFVLDRIYCNLLYSNDMIVKRIYQCEQGHKFSTFEKKSECPQCRKSTAAKSNVKLIEIQTIELSDEDEMIYKFLTKKIKDAVNSKMKAMNKIKDKGPLNKIKSLEESKEEHYRALMMKDIWLRKFMQDLRLYLKVSSSDPSNALFGGGA